MAAESSGRATGEPGAASATNLMVARAQCSASSGAQDPDDSSACVALQQDWIEVQGQQHQKMPSLAGASVSSETAEAFRTSWDKVFDAVEHVVTFWTGAPHARPDKREENLTTEQRFRLRDLLRYNLKTVRAQRRFLLRRCPVVPATLLEAETS
jgi:hypothetical protein